MRTAIPGLGEIRGDYAVISPALGSTAQVLRAFTLLLWVVLIAAAVVDPGEFTGKALIMTAAVAAVYAAKFGWRRLTARLGANRCYLCADGVAVTDRFGRMRDSVTWSEMTEIRELTAIDLTAAFHRIEISRTTSPTPLWLVAPGAQSALVEALRRQLSAWPGHR